MGKTEAASASFVRFICNTTNTPLVCPDVVLVFAEHPGTRTVGGVYDPDIRKSVKGRLD